MAKPESERPAGTKFWLASDVEQWIRDNVPESTDPAKDAIWWKAYRDAEAFADSARIKDWAGMFVDGVKAYDAEDVTSGLQDPYEDEPWIYPSEHDEFVEKDLRVFFGKDERWKP